MPKRRIVHVITRLIAGGAEENTILTCNHQAAVGNDVVLIAGRSVDPATAAKLDPGVELLVARSLIRSVSPIHDPMALAWLAATLRRLKPDVIHTHTSKAGILGRLAALAVPKCVVVHSVHILPFVNVGPVEAAVYLALERVAARWTDLFIDVSEGMKRICLDRRVGRETNHVVIESGMDLDRFRRAETPETWQPEATVPGGGRCLVVLISGALEKRKRVHEFLPVFDTVRKSVPEAKLLIAGDGPMRRDVEQSIAAIGLKASVHCLGHVDDLPSMIALADVCVHAAHREGLPRVVVQYAVVGRPIVAADLPGLDRIVHHGATGYLVPGDNLAAMAEPLIALLRDKGLRDRFGTASRAQDFSPWDAATMVEAIDRAYERSFPMSAPPLAQRPT